VINFLASSDPKYCCKGKTHKRVHSVHCRALSRKRVCDRSWILFVTIVDTLVL